MKRAAIIGGSGYTGGELLRLLSRHPFIEITAVTSERSAGKPVSDLFPGTRNCRLHFEPFRIKGIISKADLFFLCLPHKESQEAVACIYNAGKKAIDLSADYRIKSSPVYRKWYGTKHAFPALLKKAVYGLPELNRERIKYASIIANPGCYPVSAILGLAPLMRSADVDRGSIIVDSKSGVSGAGRNPIPSLLFSEVNESIKAYSIASHRHRPEIEQELSSLSGRAVSITFTPHLIPVDRGILSTIYLKASKNISLSSLQRAYRNYYHDEPFVRILKNGEYPTTKAVRGSNYCDISVFYDKRAGRPGTVIIISAIDNLLKGASGVAVQNMNILCGFDETTALLPDPFYP